MRPDSLDDYAGILRRRLFVILAATLIITGGVVAVGLRLPRVYSASVLMDVEPSRDTGSSLIPNLVQTALGGGGSDPILMQTIVNRLSTRALISRVYREFMAAEPVGARRLPPVSHLGRSIRPGVEPGSRLIALTVELSEGEGGARNAALLANQLVRTLQSQLDEENVSDQHQETGVQLTLLQAKRTDLETLLDTMRSDILAFADEHGNPTLWSAELTQLLSRESALRQERRQATFRRTEAEAALKVAEGLLTAEPARLLTSTTQSRNPTLTALEQEQIRVQTEAVQKQASGLDAAHPDRAGLTAAETYLKARIAGSTATVDSETFGRNPNRDALRTRKIDGDIALAAIQDEITELDALLAGVEAELGVRMERIPTSQLTLESLQRQAEAVTSVYEELLVRQSQMELAYAFGTNRDGRATRRKGGIALIDPALPQFRPIRPRPMLLAASGGVLGALLGVALAIALEWRFHRLRDEPEMAPAGSGENA
ncbi:hypothetical protein HN371_22545 [Candidatus Poribacteria bacterium]|nr:hypothetical protein [Candidatus Poribacteria bacterium]MBT5536857.1 hypothetical protein [Candidatus Poribacteria bacterium]MBT5713297.1 hypothetical protein [Candidatus Poribacteria bacterium]MBT7098581.1 hypothetical protein [Candidatus Poribacteria bacterium]MBT7804291.1 hypothetical protein [Candidatus Poribacteria bacterium]